jgi:hypothetical protein
MFPVTRLYESEHDAQEVIRKLAAAGFSDSDIVAIYPSTENYEAQVDQAAEAGGIQNGHRKPLKEALARGRSVVCAHAAYGYVGVAEATMDPKSVDAGMVKDYVPNNPAPLSDLLGMPVLKSSKSYTPLSPFNSNSSFGFKMISRNPAPFSSMFGMKLLSSKRGSIARGTAVEKMSGNPSPFSSLIGLKLLTSRKSARGTAIERMSGNPAPFSNALGLNLLSRRRG